MPPSSEAAARFRDLHRQGLLRLANAWDAGTARLIEQRGAAAVATTSAGLAWAQGYADGDRLDPDVLLQAFSRIARVIRVPLTVDVEGGYSDDPDSVAALVLRVVHAGAAGINLEDGAGAPDLLAAKIRAICEACVAQGADVFIHAARPCALSPAARPAQATNGRSATETGAALSKHHWRSRGLPLSDPTASGRVFFLPAVARLSARPDPTKAPAPAPGRTAPARSPRSASRPCCASAGYAWGGSPVPNPLRLSPPAQRRVKRKCITPRSASAFPHLPHRKPPAPPPGIRVPTATGRDGARCRTAGAGGRRAPTASSPAPG